MSIVPLFTLYGMISGSIVHQKTPEEFWKEAKARGVELVREVDQGERARSAPPNPDRQTLTWIVTIPLSTTIERELSLAGQARTNTCGTHEEECKHGADCGQIIFEDISLDVTSQEFESALKPVAESVNKTLIEYLESKLVSGLVFPDTRAPGEGLRNVIFSFWMNPQWGPGFPTGGTESILRDFYIALAKDMERTPLPRGSIKTDIPPCTTVFVRPRAGLKISFASTYRGRMTLVCDKEGTVQACRLGPGFLQGSHLDVSIAFDSKTERVRTCECKKLGRRSSPPIKDRWEGPWVVAVVIDCAPGRYKVVRPLDPACNEVQVGENQKTEVRTASPASVTYTFTATGKEPGDDTASLVETCGDKPVIAERPLAFTAPGSEKSFLYMEGDNGTAMELDAILRKTTEGTVVYVVPSVPKRLACAEKLKVVQMTEELKSGLSCTFENAAGKSSFAFSFIPVGRSRRSSASSSSKPPCDK